MTAVEFEKTAKALLGKRIQIPAHYDMWMRGARFGEVKSWRHGKDGRSGYISAALDNVTRRQKIWSIDLEYVTVI